MRILKAIGLTLLGVFTLMCGISHAGVAGGKHDLGQFGNSTYQFDTDQTCVFCHTPHSGRTDITEQTYQTDGESTRQNTTGTGFLLWNRALTNATSYLPYESSTLDASTAQLRVYSLMCLGCHDGVGSLNVVQNYPGSGSSGPIPELSGIDQIGDFDHPDLGFLAPGDNIGERYGDQLSMYGTDDGVLHLENDHPISIDYDSSHPDVSSGGLNNPAFPTEGYVDAAKKVRLFYSPVTFGNTSLECSSCHDVHNDGVNTALEPFLVMSNNQSALCTTCHNK